MLNKRFKDGDIVYVREHATPLYLAVVHDHNPGALVPVTVFREYVIDGRRDAHMVFALNLRHALWTFTGFVEQPCHALK